MKPWQKINSSYLGLGHPFVHGTVPDEKSVRFGYLLSGTLLDSET